jgi:hypothetical protein
MIYLKMSIMSKKNDETHVTNTNTNKYTSDDNNIANILNTITADDWCVRS